MYKEAALPLLTQGAELLIITRSQRKIKAP